MNIETRKKEIIAIISRIENEALIERLETAIRNLEKDRMALSGILKPTREKLDINKLKKEQGFSGIDRIRFEQLTQEIDIREDVEELLSEL